jgi:hypothetical protein
MRLLLVALALHPLTGAARLDAADPWLHLPGPGPKVVLVSGDEEYRSEEALPQLAKILNTHHGFDCTVLFAIDPKTGAIDPYVTDNIPGIEKVATADLVVLALRFRNLPDDKLKHLIDYAEAGKPLVALRTSTHALNLTGSKQYQKWTWNSKEPGYEGGFGRKFLGETWVAHHGQHGKEGTRGVPAPGQQSHPVLRGFSPGDVFGPTDVYTADPPADFTRVLLGQVTRTLSPDSPPVEGKKNDPMQPVVWVRGKTFVTTLGASQDLAYEATRRLVVNGCFWALGKEVPAKAEVSLVGDYQPSPFKFKGHKPGVKPEDLK